MLLMLIEMRSCFEFLAAFVTRNLSFEMSRFNVSYHQCFALVTVGLLTFCALKSRSCSLKVSGNLAEMIIFF